MKYFIYFFIFFIYCFSSCEKPEEKSEEIVNVNIVSRIQFYVDPQKFNQGNSGRIISAITINNINYLPKSFVDNCTEMYTPPITSSINGREYFHYKINMKNYKSLDAIMNGLPFSIEYWEGFIYLDNLKLGCNTLEVKESNGSQLFVLTLR